MTFPFIPNDRNSFPPIHHSEENERVQKPILVGIAIKLLNHPDTASTLLLNTNGLPMAGTVSTASP